MVLAVAAFSLLSSASALALPSTQLFKHVSAENVSSAQLNDEVKEAVQSSALEPDSLLPRSVEQILSSLPPSYSYLKYPVKAAGPWVISGYRPLPDKSFHVGEVTMKSILGRKYATNGDIPELAEVDSVAAPAMLIPPAVTAENEDVALEEASEEDVLTGEDIIVMDSVVLDSDESADLPPIARGEYMPGWLREALVNDRLQDDAMYRIMMADPSSIEYARWDLPEPPRLPEEDPTFLGFLRRLQIPEVDLSKAVMGEDNIGRRNWLHTFNTGLQFSQAYFSRNWYQGGTNHISLLFNFLWDVSLNQVFHPNLMLQSVVSYKLGVSTNPKGSLHKYQISADAFQWNFKTGLRAFTKWFYSFNAQFKTQMLENYAADSEVRTASFLSPGEFNAGLGMTFNHENEKKTFKFSLSISPLSYNLKTCIDPQIDRTQFKITPPARTVNEIGSNLEATYEWQIISNITWRSRLFAFSDYRSLLGDWENTLDFAINQFLSTQFYFHLRYDSSTPNTFNTGWGKWQFKEFLSFGLSYTFNTKP